MLGRLIIVGGSGTVSGHIVVVSVPGGVPRYCSIAVRTRGINKTNLVRSDEKIREDNRGVVLCRLRLKA